MVCLQALKTLTLFLTYHLIRNFLQASLSLKPSCRKIISEQVKEQNGYPPLCIITDMFFGWCAEIAHEFGAFHAIFSGCGGFGFACYHSVVESASSEQSL